MSDEKVTLKGSILTKRNKEGNILWIVDIQDPDWYHEIAHIEKSMEKPVDLKTTGHRVFRWNNYVFNFAVGDDDTIIEVAMNIPKVSYIPEIPALRVGIILEDEDAQYWEIVFMEPFFMPPCRLKGANRFESPEGIYSPYGWTGFRYKLKKLEK